MTFLSGFGKRKAIKYGTVFPGSNLTDFPKLFNIDTDTDIATELVLGGGIAVTLADGTTTVPFGIYPSTSLSLGTVLMRALFSPLTGASTGDVLGYLYYDASQTTSEDKAGAVANGYALFMPLEEDPSSSAPQMLDWVSNSLIGTANGTWSSGQLVPAEVGNGLSFSGSDYIGLPGNLPTPPMSVEAWITPTNTGGLDGIIGDQSQNDSGLMLVTLSDQILAQWSNSGTVITLKSMFFGALTNGVTAAISFSIDGLGNAIGYQDGAQSNSVPGIVFSPGVIPLLLGKWASFGYHGVIDELRVSSVVRSADWIAYQYADDFTNSDTFSLGAQETSGGGFDAATMPRTTNVDFHRQKYEAVQY